MARTVDDLAGHGGLAVEQGNGPVDLADLAESAVAEHVGPARARGVDVELIGGISFDRSVGRPGRGAYRHRELSQ